ncbi:MAG TPA: glycosyl hydrolase family 92, partial [Flavobacteriales bacterium]|nr:glycosyl hydrolase family 92 [Flavobacteriales bacterium]
ALHPLLAWIEPTRTRDMVRTMLRMYRDGGQLPVWELASNYTGCMIGYHSVPVMVDALAWDIGDWDQTLALEAMVQAADSMHLGLDAYAEMGYIPSDHEHESVSKTLEYAFDDACIARMAAHLNQADVETRFRRRAAHWTNLYNPASGFIQSKRKGAWNEGFEPREVNFNFTEANAWQYLFAAQHDIQGQAALAGGDAAYLAKIDAMFNAPVQTTGRVQPDITGLRGQYAHGNEPSHHVSYLASYAGAPSQTADRVRDICKNLYNDSPAGLCGNEDCGQMSAWYVWSTMGMYPVEPGSGQLVLGSPLFEQTVVRPAQGEPTTLDAPKAATRPYIDQAAWTSLHGHVSEGASRSFVTTQQLRQGGTLNLKMSDKPGDRFGVKPEDRPKSLWESPGFLAVPGIEAPRTFQSESAAFQLLHIQPDAVLSYSVDDGATWDIYDGPVAIQETTHILARATLDDLTSNTAAHTMLKVDHGWRMTLEHAPDNQYLAGGDQALIDGLEGGHDFRTGEWQGFWGAPMVARIDLGRVCNVQAIEVHALQDIKPWIWAPRHVQFSASKDGRDFDVEGRVDVNVEEDDTEVQVVTYRLDKPIRTRHLEIAAAPHASIPEWHLGRGNDRWMFLDEIRVDIQTP